MAWNNQGSLRGAAGAQLRYGNGAPTASNPSVQNDLDSYIDVQNGRLYAVRTNGSWPTTYASLIGPMGSSVRVGTGAPTSSNPTTQNDGDVYIQTDATNGPALWGPRSGGTWPASATSLAGAAGASFLSGSGAPANTLGTSATPGYYDYTNFVIYGPKKSDGTWPAGNSLVGPKGSQFYTDTAAPGLQLGTVGDFFFRSDTYDFFIKITNAAAATTAQYPNGWLVMANLKGATGTAGTNGTNGTNGVSPPGLYYGSGAPGTVSGAQVGSFYIRTDTTQLYGPLASNGSWGGPVNLIGTVSLPNDITGNSVVVAPVSGDSNPVQLAVNNGSGTSLFKADSSGNVTVAGTLQATGSTTLASLSATTASVLGNASVAGTLGVTGATTVGAMSASSSAISGNETVGGTFKVTGSTTLAGVTAGAITCTSINNTGGGSVSGTFSAAALALTLPASGAATFPILLKNNGGTTLLSVDTSGNLICAAVSATNISASGTLSVTGATTLGTATTGALSASSVSSNSASVSGAVAAQAVNVTLPSSGAAQFPYTLKNAGGTSLFNVDNTGNIAGGNIYGQGTLQMIGAATMAGVSATTLSASGAVTLSTTLAVTGATTLSSTLNVAGATTAAAITSSATVTAKNLTLTNGGGGVVTFADGTTQSTAATGSGSSGRGGTVQGMIWLPNNTASGTAYPFSTVISYVTGTATQANIPLRKTMGAAGTIFGVSLSCPGSVSGGAMTFTLLKNGTAVWTQSNAITGNTGATPSDTFSKPSSAVSFAAGDVFTMTGTFTTTGGQAVQAALEYQYTT